MSEITVNISDEAMELLEKLAAKNGTTVEKTVGVIVGDFFAVGG